MCMVNLGSFTPSRMAFSRREEKHGSMAAARHGRRGHVSIGGVGVCKKETWGVGRRLERLPPLSWQDVCWQPVSVF